MEKKNHCLLIFAVGLLAGPLVALGQGNYDYQTIDYPGASDTEVFGVNERGDAVGDGFAANIVPFVYDTKNGMFTNVAPVAGYADTSVLGISDSGALVGSVLSLDLSTESGLILDQKGNATVFDHPDAVVFTQARGVNNQGLVTGFRDSEDDQFLPENGFIYDPKTDTFTNIVPSIFTIAQGINTRGDVVGHAVFEDEPCPDFPGPFVRYGWLRTADGAVIYFNVNGGSTSARGITDSGTIAGFVSDLNDGTTKGFVVELDGSQCQSITVSDADLLQFPGALETFLEGIKNSGEVVGSFNDATNSHGFIATPE